MIQFAHINWLAVHCPLFLELLLMVIPENWNVPTIFRQRLGAESGRQRIMSNDNHLLIILHAPPGPNDAHRVGRLFWRNPEGGWKCSFNDLGPRGLQHHMDELSAALTDCENLEMHASRSHEYFEVLSRTAPLTRTIRNAARTLQEAREACSEDRDLINFRDRAVDLERSAELLFQDTKNSMDYLIARQTELQAEASGRMADSAYKLNLFAAFFFPIATLTAVFGTNLRSGLEELWAPWLWVAVLISGIGLGGLLTWFVLPANQSKTSRKSSTKTESH